MSPAQHVLQSWFGQSWFGPPANVWLAAMGVAATGLVAHVALPRVTRAAAMAVLSLSVVVAVVASSRGDVVHTLAFLTLAVSSGLVARWARREVARSVGGPSRSRRVADYRLPGRAPLTRAQVRAFDRIVAREAARARA